MRSWISRAFGPSTLVAAAFIGPGTVTVCSLAGATSGFELLWALLFSTLATLFLQEMSARLGLISRSGLGEALRTSLNAPFLRISAAALVLSAIVVGNAAYEGGNLSGAALGLGELLPQVSQSWRASAIGLAAFTLLLTGSVKLVERVLIWMVVAMSVLFAATAILLQPPPGPMLKGLFIPSFDNQHLMLVVGLIGTTVVPYNLFLHASTVQHKWKRAEDLKGLRMENAVSILLGGLISMCIIVSSAVAFEGQPKGLATAADMAVQLEPLLGPWARYAFAGGFFAAGLTSALTAPLAAAYAARGILGWRHSWTEPRFRAVWMGVLACGIGVSASGIRPVEVIRFAQVANGLLLPVIAGFLLTVMNRPELLGRHVNKPWQNAVGIVVVLCTIAIGAKALLTAFGG
jgi:manganese transport protein